MRYIPFIDLTSLNETDDAASIETLCQKARTRFGCVAAVCIYPQFVALAKQCLTDNLIAIATVANFPSGDQGIEPCLAEIQQSLADGADEIDVVLPYSHYLKGDKSFVFRFLNACRETIADKTLKVILETGALISHDHIVDAATIAIECGADFVKTSSGKIATGATVSAVNAMLAAIQLQPDKKVGLKISGGIRTLDDVSRYSNIVTEKMGNPWLIPQHFRIGASQLLDELIKSSM